MKDANDVNNINNVNPEPGKPVAQPRVLITGIDGMTGHYVVQALMHDGYEVHGTVHRPKAAPPVPGTILHTLDLCNALATHQVIRKVQPQAVVHLAAIAFVAHDDIDALYRVNLLATRHLLAALATLNPSPRIVVLASSANIYGNTLIDPIDEQTPPQPANDYAVSKLAMEHMARLWMDRLPIVITRPFNYTGVGQSEQFLLPKIVAHFKARQPVIELGNLEVIRDFSDVRRVAAAYAGLVRVAPAGQVYNLCSGQGTSLTQVISLLEEIADYPIAVKVNPAFVRANEVKRLVGDGRRLTAAIGALPTFALSETLRWMYETPGL